MTRMQKRAINAASKSLFMQRMQREHNLTDERRVELVREYVFTKHDLSLAGFVARELAV